VIVTVVTQSKLGCRPKTVHRLWIARIACKWHLSG
jgi:hypothetical protein